MLIYYNMCHLSTAFVKCPRGILKLSCQLPDSGELKSISLLLTAYKHHPVKAVAEAGGWQDLETLQICYQHPDRDALSEVMSEPRKLRDAAVMG